MGAAHAVAQRAGVGSCVLQMGANGTWRVSSACTWRSFWPCLRGCGIVGDVRYCTGVTFGPLGMPNVPSGVLNAVAFWYDLEMYKADDDGCGNGSGGGGGSVCDSACGGQQGDTGRTPPRWLSNAPPGLVMALESEPGAATANHSGPGSGVRRKHARGSSGGSSRRRLRTQALQYLDCALPVAPHKPAAGAAAPTAAGGGAAGGSGGGGSGASVVLTARRRPDGLRFEMRPGVGMPVPRPPFKVRYVQRQATGGLNPTGDCEVTRLPPAVPCCGAQLKGKHCVGYMPTLPPQTTHRPAVLPHTATQPGPSL